MVAIVLPSGAFPSPLEANSRARHEVEPRAEVHMRYIIQRGSRSAGAWRSVVLLGTLVLTTACRNDDPLPTGPRVATPSGPLVSIAGANVTSLPFEGVAINDAGQVAGTQNPQSGQPRAVLYTPGVGVQDLGTLGGTISVAYALNELGQVAGYGTTATGARHAFLWTPGAGMQDLGTLGGGTASTARGINDLGQVVGEVTLPPVGPRQPAKHAFRWTPGEGMEDLGTLSPELTSSIAYDINNTGQVVGRAFSADRQILPPTDPEYFSRAFLWAPGQGMRDLGDLGGGYSIAYAISDAGQVIGRSWLSQIIAEFGQAYSAFIWTSAEGMRAIGRLWGGPEISVAYGINEAGQVVGENELLFVFPGVPFQTFLWSAAEGTEALSPTTGFRTARDINNHQQVVGDGHVATLHLTPGNDLPVAASGGPYTGTEGSPVALDLSATDNNDVGFVYRVSYGDGSPDWTDIRLTSSALNHVYGDNGTYTLTLTVRDPKGASDTKTTTVTIANVAPAIVEGSLTGPTEPIQLTGGNASAPISFEFTDMGGKQDVYTAEVACGNGVVLTATDIPVVETYQNNEYTGGKGTYSGACAYTSAGVYTVRATVSDGDGGTSSPAFVRYVIVYDPAGGSTVGSGFYTVPGQGNRKAHFAFDASFPNGATVPNGTVELWIPGGEMNFESSGVEMLVVSGNWAQFWGTGTLNGAAARFRITVIAGQANGHDGAADAIRIELWDAGGATVLHDTQPGAAQDAPVTTPIDGGNIRIR
jgi:probable HAF family extracellular repeat protein